MDTAANGVSEGVSAAVGAGAHIGHQLYTQGVSALTNAASAAKSAVTDLGDGPFGRALKQAWRPAVMLAGPCGGRRPGPRLWFWPGRAAASGWR